MAFNDWFKCKVCGIKFEYSLLCYLFTPKELQPRHSDDEICASCEDWSRHQKASRPFTVHPGVPG